MDGFEGFEFRPWMGYVGGVALVAVAWNSDAPLAMITRGLGLTLFFGTDAWRYRSHRLRSRAGPSIFEVKSWVFSAFGAILTIVFIVAVFVDWFEKVRGN